MSLSATGWLAGRYRLDRRIAIDRYCEVWHGTDVELARSVAIKLLRADASDDETASQFRVTACQAASLTHQGLVRVFDYYEPSDSDSAQRPFMVMEFVDGQSLADQIRAGQLGPDRTVDILAQVGAALLPIHRAVLAHGDIRPEKILISSDGAAKLFGFSGLSAAGPAAIGADLRALGTLARDCGAAGHSEPAADLIADLCACESAHADTTAAFARRAAALRKPRFRPAAPRRGSTPQPGRGSPASTQPLPAVRTPATRWAMAGRTAAILAIALAAVTIYGAFKPGSTAPDADRAAGSAAATSVRVNAAQIVGQPVQAVLLRLRRLGLVTRVRWRTSNSIKAGEVMAVRPTGLVPVHSTVVIVASAGLSATSNAPDLSRGPNAHRKPKRSPSPSHSPAATSSTPGPSRSPSTSPTPTPSPSPSSSPAPSPSPTSPSPSASSSSPNPAPSSTPPFPDRLLDG